MSKECQRLTFELKSVCVRWCAAMQRNPKGVAVKIKQRLGPQIDRACLRTIAPPHFLAGLVSVENVECDPDAKRFEPAVFEKLKAIRSPLIFWKRSWNGITQADLKGLSDVFLVDLATSWGYTQIMGWRAIPLRRTVAEIRDPFLHLMIAVQLLDRNAREYLVRGLPENALRIWNTGSPDGRTSDPQYVANAMTVMKEYREL